MTSNQKSDNHSASNDRPNSRNGNPAGENAGGGGDVDLMKYLYSLWNARWLIVSSVVIGGILALLIAFLVTPFYGANGTMMIKQSQQSSPLMNALGGNSAISGLIGSSFGVGGGVNIGNEQEVLESRKLFNAMAKKLIDDPIMENGRMYPVLWQEWPNDSLMIEQRYVAGRIEKNISYELLSRTTIIEISYESPSPMEAVRMVNMAMATYQEISRRQNLELANSATDFLDSEEVEIQDSLSSAEENLGQFMDTNEIVQLDAQTGQLIQQIAELRRSRYEAEVELRGTNASIEEYQSRLDKLKPGLAQKLANAIGPNVEKMQYQISELKTEKALIYSRQPSLKRDNVQPEKIQNLNAQISELKDQIETETDSLVASSSEEFIGLLGGDGQGSSVINTLTEYSSRLIQLRVKKLQFEAQIDYLNELLNEQEQFLENVPGNAVQLARLKRNLKVQEELYLAVTKQRAQMDMSAKAELGNSRPLDPAIIPNNPAYPNYLLFFLIGVFTTGFLSVAYVTIRSVVSETINNTEDINEVDLPLLSVIPRFGERGRYGFPRYGSANGQNASLYKAFHRLANNIIYADKPVQTMTVTASQSAEGTTTICGNLAIALAQAGNRVIVVETDNQRSDLSLFFDKGTAKGLSEVLDKKSSLDDAIAKSEISTLHFLSSGTSSPLLANLQSSEFKKVVSELRERYDYILFDTAALDVSNDATDLAGVADTTILIAKFGKTKIPELQFSAEQLRSVHAPILGVVLNEYDADKSTEFKMNAYEAEN
jgi:capsular exopolysaccharide synthesis family protein